MQVYVRLNEELTLHYVQAMGLTVSLRAGKVCVCVCLHSGWNKGFSNWFSSASGQELCTSGFTLMTDPTLC